MDKDFIIEKISLITTGLEKLAGFSNSTFDEIAGDYIKYAALKNILMEIIGRAIDINEYLIAQISPADSETPKTYRETFLILAKLGVLPPDFAREISKSAGFRNAIVHEYNNLDKSTVYKTVGQAIEQYKAYCRYIAEFIEKSKSAD